MSNLTPMPGFNAEQTSSLQDIITTAVNQAVHQAVAAFIEARFGPDDHQIVAPPHAHLAEKPATSQAATELSANQPSAAPQFTAEPPQASPSFEIHPHTMGPRST